MPTARLPDINTAFIKYRSLAITALESRKYNAVFGALFALNGELPPESDKNPKSYRVKISTPEYESITKQDTLAVCRGCQETTNKEALRILDLVNAPLQAMISGKKSERVWVCRCGHENFLSTTEFNKKQLNKPYYLGVVPDPPERKGGMLGRTAYHKAVDRWAWTMLDEIEAKMAEYRDDNWKKGSRTEDDEEETEQGDAD